MPTRSEKPTAREKALAAFRTLGRITLTLGFVAASAAAVVGGRGVLAERAASVEQPEPAPVTSVSVQEIALQTSHSVTRRFTGQFEPRQQTDVAFERTGTIATIAVREGDQVAIGQELAALDTRLLEAERLRLRATRQAVQAQAELAARTNTRQSELRDRGFVATQRVDETSLTLTRLQANLAEIDASLATVDVQLSQSRLVAPFSGTIATRLKDDGAVATPGAPVLRVQEDRRPQFRVGLDPRLASEMTIGQAATIRTGQQEIPAVLASIAPDLDPATRSRIAFFDVDGPTPAARSSAELHLAIQQDGRGAWVPLSALRQGPRGSWTLLGVLDGKIALFGAEILSLDTDRAFVRGTFSDGTLLLTSGTHRVVPGEPVSVINDTPEDLAWAR